MKNGRVDRKRSDRKQEDLKMTQNNYRPLEILIYPKKTDGRILGSAEKGPSRFGIGYDSTDHFWFFCPKCKEQATVQRVERSDAYANMPTIYFLLKCPKCSAKGFRKIYLEYATRDPIKQPKLFEERKKEDCKK